MVWHCFSDLFREAGRGENESGANENTLTPP